MVSHLCQNLEDGIFLSPLTGHYLQIYVQANVQGKIMVRLKYRNMCLDKQSRVIGCMCGL